MNHFHTAIHSCNFIDLGYFGSPFTWSCNHPTEGGIHIRLDQTLANPAWKLLYQNATVHHILMFSLNHSMFAIRLNQSMSWQPRSKPLFRFEAMWLQDPWCADIVQDAWHEGLYKPDGMAIINCHASCRDRLLVWNKHEFGHVGKQIARLNQKLQILEQHPIRMMLKFKRYEWLWING